MSAVMAKTPLTRQSKKSPPHPPPSIEYANEMLMNMYDVVLFQGSENTDAWRNLSQPAWPYDPTGMAGYPYGTR